MSEFLDRVQASAALEDHDQALEAVRAVFYALFRGIGNGSGREPTREASEHLPEDLETLWKPALFACLGEDRAAGEETSGVGTGASGSEAFVVRVRRRAPDLDSERVERVARAVLHELRPLVPSEGRSALARGLPDHLRDDWTG